MKKFFQSEAWQWILCGIKFAVIVCIIVGVLLAMQEFGFAEDVWVLCDPDSFVCVRDAPRKTSYAFGGITCGSRLTSDGKQKNHYLHVVEVPAESDTGWISTMFIVYDEPIPLYQSATVVSNGRLAARKGIGGKVRKWLKPMDQLTIYWWSNEWCLTNYGYVQSMYLELDGED